MSRTPATISSPLPLSPPPSPPPKGCELLRENVYEAGRRHDVDEVRKRRRPTMAGHKERLVDPPAGTNKKYTVVLDLDETVVYAREGPLYARAYLRELLRSIKDVFEVIVWTAGEREYAKNILEEINQEHIIQHLIYRHGAWFRSEDYTKDLKKLGRNIDYVIIVENTPDCVRANPQNGIIVEDFEVPCTPPLESQEREATTQGASTAPPPSPPLASPPLHSPHRSPSSPHTPSLSPAKQKRQFTDRTLLLLQEVLLALAESGETVPTFLAKCPLLTQQEVLGSDGQSIPTYYLGKRRKRGAPSSLSPRKCVTRSTTASQSSGEEKEVQNNRRMRGKKRL
ncbi:nuclear lim interactor-interacting factor [Trypanosoma rangeli]|uniref:Mitochondrial import inner membrane translocase subunit TIM50 n=1 Tax=Trypanosoma rangeli TaxID=5698 RepID=A0A3R7P338_TRYRA|nr:nuclear lim interactor-interacting factor [Trypanosoma rangeli]RNF11991.1 nuclear lim interactor-interacting factor [Trypanosoma rangeli]|eukprot:RNF11991.1 nuclear lim interactor-interacting factor [Trypanosoma rangeli]